MAKHEATAAVPPPKRRGMPRGRRKGYQNPICDQDEVATLAGRRKIPIDEARAELVEKRREEILAKKPARTKLHGIVGTVPDLYQRIDDALRERDWNWVTLADAIPCSRQYLVDVTERDVIPIEFFYNICRVLQWSAKDMIETEENE